MSLGGGSFTIENKVMPGAYINFVSDKRGDFTLTDRGIGAMGIALDWGSISPVVVDKSEIRQDCIKLFGYDYYSDEMIYIREFFRHGKTLIVGRINGGTKAQNDLASAKYSGLRGNSLCVVITKDVDFVTKYNVDTYIGGQHMDRQTVYSMSELKDNDFVVWKKNSDIAVGIYKFTGGTSAMPTGNNITAFCNHIEQYRFNMLTVLADDNELQDIMIEFTRRLRDEQGIKFQYVVYDNAVDYEGVVSVYNSDGYGIYECGMTAWIMGALAGCQVNESITNMKYDGEIDMGLVTAQTNIERLTKQGHILLHNVDDDIRVVLDINTFVSFTDEKGEVFQNNQTIRVCDQIATDVASLFTNYYLGKVPNDKAGRNSLWAELVKYHEKLEDIRAIDDFDEDDIEVRRGDSKNSVIVSESIVPVNSMDKIYMTVYVE